MKAKYILTVLILSTLAVFPGLGYSNPTISASAQAGEESQITRHGAWLDSMVFTEQGNFSQAITQLQANLLDVLAYQVDDSALYHTVISDPNLTQTLTYGSFVELSFNPAGPTFDNGQLNPFSNARIREAMNWLVNRDYIAQVIYAGLAAPKYAPLTRELPDYVRYQDTVQALEATYAYNFTQAQSVIATEMESMGATLVDGTWHYASQPVIVIFIIRVEDERLAIGDYVSDQLEAIGFTVNRQYKTYSDANLIWNLSNPNEGLWHIYTGGWLNTSISRDDGTNFGFFYTPLGSQSPLWQAYKPTPEFQAVCNHLWNNDFSSIEERNNLFEQAIVMAMNDAGTGPNGAGSLRVWLVDTMGFTPRRLSTRVASDLVGGVTSSAMFPYVARFDGLEGGTLRIAQPGLLVDVWNPIGGSNWIYDQFPIRATEDQATLTDPNTGLEWAQRIGRAECVIKEGVPITRSLGWVNIAFSPTITVPENAWVDWDATSQTFITAGSVPSPILVANTKCTITYPDNLFTSASWHDGSPLTIGDFIMRMIMRFDRAKPESAIYDGSDAWKLDAFKSHFRGVQIESIDPLVITTYDDMTNFIDAELLASQKSWWPNYDYGPAAWHTLSIATRAEAAEQLAFTNDKANVLSVEQTNYIGGPSLDILASWMNQSASEHYIPYLPTMGMYVTQAEADARWAALQNWYAAHHHFWVGTGPFYVEQISYNPKSITLTHFNAFPDPAGRWEAFAAQARLTINHSSGAPGSYFNITGSGFPPNSNALVEVNDLLLGTLQVDSIGFVAFTLNTVDADPGGYHVEVSVNPTAQAIFLLDQGESVLPRIGNYPVFLAPEGRAFQRFHIPVVLQNFSDQ